MTNNMTMMTSVGKFRFFFYFLFFFIFKLGGVLDISLETLVLTLDFFYLYLS